MNGTVVDTIRVVSVMDSSFVASINESALYAFGSGLALALIACTLSAAIVMLGVAVHRAIG